MSAKQETGKIHMSQKVVRAILNLDKAIQNRSARYRELENLLEIVEETFKQDFDKLVASLTNLPLMEYERELKLLRENKKNRQAKIKRQRYQIKRSFYQEWITALEVLDDLCKRIRSRQPHLNDLKRENINTSDFFPDAVAFGRIRLSYEGWHGYIPRLVEFPFNKALWVPDVSVQLMIHQLLLRLMSALPVKYLDITAVDPRRLGRSVSPFLPLLNLRKPFIEQRILTRADEIEATLQQMLDYVENLLQKSFQGDITDWAQYNSINLGAPLSYRVLLVFGVPEQLSDRSMWYLERLLEHGPRCGVLPVLTVDQSNLEGGRYKRLRKAVETHAKPIKDLLTSQIFSRGVSDLLVEEEEEFWPDEEALTEIIGWLFAEYEKSGLFVNKITELWDGYYFWQETSVSGLNVPIGWSYDGQEILLALGGVNTEHHVLLAGRSGSGKSNLLHVLIHSLCHRYSPAEVKIYLLDYKQGTEFNGYANPPLPQAALVATESDPEYGVTVLAHIVTELERRSSEFKEHFVRDIQEYRQKTKVELPRVLLIIDEFQILFSEGRQVAEPAEKLLTTLLRQGRAYGIHVLLATQTLRGIQSLSMGQLISQIGCRIALACSEEDSAFILGNTNWAASTLNSPPEGLLNNANGAKSANQRFLIPAADRELCNTHQQNISEFGCSRGYVSSTKVFSGASLPAAPPDNEFRSAQISFRYPNLLLGEELCFEANYFSVRLDKRVGGNLLIAGYDEAIKAGLLFSTLSSLTNTDNVSEIVYYNARVEQFQSEGCDPGMFGHPLISIMENDWDGDLAKLTVSQNGIKVLIIDGLDTAKLFHGSGVFKQFKKDEPPAPADLLKTMLEEGPPRGLFTICFVDNWHRCTSVCKELLPFFELRLGFCLNEDDAGSFISGSMARLKGLEQGNKAVFVDRLKNVQTWLRPFTKR